MISRELAKELKDANFPHSWCYEMQNCIEAENCNDPGWHCFPTLTELIEACGEGFSELRRNYTGVPFGAPGKWLACHSPDRGETDDCVVENSADEAVARLWLFLNPKKA